MICPRSLCSTLYIWLAYVLSPPYLMWTLLFPHRPKVCMEIPFFSPPSRSRKIDLVHVQQLSWPFYFRRLPVRIHPAISRVIGIGDLFLVCYFYCHFGRMIFSFDVVRLHASAIALIDDVYAVRPSVCLSRKHTRLCLVLLSLVPFSAFHAVPRQVSLSD